MINHVTESPQVLSDEIRYTGNLPGNQYTAFPQVKVYNRSCKDLAGLRP